MSKRLIAVLMVAGCASGGSKVERGEARAAGEAQPLSKRPGQTELPGRVGNEMQTAMQKGYISQESAEDPIQARWKEFVACYDKAGAAQRYAGGKVMLRFLIAGDGRPSDVRVIETSLGNWDVERCLVATGRRLRFAPPEGGQGTEFEYPIEFRSRRELQVSEAAIDKLTAAVTYAVGRASDCGCVVAAGEAAAMTAYVEPGGQLGSAGFASEAPIDETVGACLVQRMREGKVAPNATRYVARAIGVPLPPCAR